MKRLLLTGANGFVGSFISEEAIRQNFHVTAAVRKSSNLTFLKNLDMEYIFPEYGDEYAMIEMFRNARRYDAIIHNAGLTKAATAHAYKTVNTEFTKTLVNSLIAADAVPDKFIFISSLAAAGPGNSNPPSPI